MCPGLPNLFGYFQDSRNFLTLPLVFGIRNIESFIETGECHVNATITTQALEPQTNSLHAALLYPSTNGDMRPMDVIKVSATSRSTSVAGAVAGVIRDQGHAEVQAIGASAVNQAIKAIAIAHGYLKLDNIDIVCIPAFTEVMIDGQERTAIRISVEKR